MSSYDFGEKIIVVGKDIKVHWERLLLEYTEASLSKDRVRSFKTDILIPALDRITDLAVLIVERKRQDLYGQLAAFLRSVTDLSTYYQRQTKNIGFNYSSETEHLSFLLPGYEATVRMLTIGSVAVAENAYDFISLLGNEQVVWLRRDDGTKVNRSIFSYPWYENGWGAGNLTTFFEEAKKRLEEDQQVRERYFSLIDDSHIDALCQFNFLQAMKVEMLGQNDWERLGFPFFPNFARYHFTRTEDVIAEFKNRDPELLKAFPVSNDGFEGFLMKYMKHIRENSRYLHAWAVLPKWFEEYLSKIDLRP